MKIQHPCLLFLFLVVCWLALHAQGVGTSAVASAVEIMQSQMRQYFYEEKVESIFFLYLGGMSFVWGLYNWKTDNRLWRGMVYPILAIGLIQLIVGGTIFWRTDQQVTDLLALISQNPMEYRAQEMARMEPVNFWFDIYRYLELTFLAVAAGLFLLARQKKHELLKGVGIGLALQSTLMLGLDFVAAYRADVYTRQLMQFSMG